MSDEADHQSLERGLYFYWYETKAGEEADIWWGQLAGGMFRLMTVRDELESLRPQRDVEKAMRRLESHVESYLVRAFEIRERALGLLASRTHRAKDVRRLRHPKERNDALPTLRSAHPELTEAVTNLLSLLDNDVDLRNRHTHHLYLSLGFCTRSNIVDPYDALLDLSHEPARRQKFEALLRREVKKTTQRYLAKVEALVDVIQKVLDAADPATRRVPPARDRGMCEGERLTRACTRPPKDRAAGDAPAVRPPRITLVVERDSG